VRNQNANKGNPGTQTGNIINGPVANAVTGNEGIDLGSDQFSPNTEETLFYSNQRQVIPSRNTAYLMIVVRRSVVL
jgi:hypothetical protein